MIYPWHQTNWQDLAKQWQSKPNAWLITGKALTGKTAFAEHLAQALLCEQPLADREPCGQCPSCHLMGQHSHPDFKLLTPFEEEGETNAKKLRQIKIDDVREALSFIQLTSHRGGMRVLLINPAETLNTQAANALLKALEEPPAGVLFILVCHNKDKLLPTIKSRCRQLPLTAPSPDVALAYLQAQGTEHAEALLAFHHGAPLFEDEPDHLAMRAELLNLLSQPRLIACLDYAAKFDQKKWPLSLFLNWLQKWCLDLAQMQQTARLGFYPEHQQALQQLAKKIDSLKLFAYLDSLNALAPYGQHTLNVKLQLEALLIDYLKLPQKSA
ncbi:MAG: DNA polymerase III subunit delta' [Neisseriaceae bacterium]|nr:DNA polymerase III subunit delta' [Neisseriaceae bacterium]